MNQESKIEIENVNVPGKTYRADRVKYEAMKELILSVTPNTKPGLTAQEMIDQITPLAPQDLWPDGEKIAWWQKTVQLDLEAKKLLIRDKDSKPLRWYVPQ